MSEDKVLKIIEEVVDEYGKAIKKFGPFNTAHEAYAVILEELEEFWDEVKKQSANRPNQNLEQMRHELKQVAAMAIRSIVDLEGDEWGEYGT